MKFNALSKKFCSYLLVIVTLFSFSSLVFASDNSLETIDGVLSQSKIDELNRSIKNTDETTSEITRVEKIITENGNEEFTVEFKLTPSNSTVKAIGTAKAHFSRTDQMNQWQCYFTINLFESIVAADYQLYWGVGSPLNYSDFSGLGTTNAVSRTHKNIYTKAGTYKPTCSIQVWGASGPYGSISVPNINTIAILFDL